MINVMKKMVVYKFLPSNPPQYQFKCSKCNNCIITDKSYPYQEIEYAIENSEKGVWFYEYT